MGFFASSFQIGSRRVGADAPCYVIAEAGLAHLGSFDLALRMVSVAKAAGADAFKTQAFNPDRLYAPGKRQERIRGRALPPWAFERLQTECNRVGIDFLLTPHDEDGLEIVRSLNPGAVKIGSGERGNSVFLQKAALLGVPVIASTGMHDAAHVDGICRAMEAAGNHHLALTHCVTAYPVPSGQSNIRRMEELKAFCPIVGYSDHSVTAFPVLIAAARGASIIEMHFRTEAWAEESNDLKVSAMPDALALSISMIRDIERELGPGGIEPRKCEASAEAWAIKQPIDGEMRRAG